MSTPPGNMQKYPPGWDERRVRDVITHYSNQTDEQLALEIDRSRYEMVMGCDVHRGGAYLELWDTGPSRRLMMEAFYSDADRTFEFEQHREVSREVDAWFRDEARRRLPPVEVAQNTEIDPQ